MEPKVKTKIEIKSISGDLIFEYEDIDNSIRKTIETAVKKGINLHGSDLRGSDLSWSNLRGSNLSWSNLHGSNLSWSDLRGSDLHGSNLRGSDLHRSDLREAKNIPEQYLTICRDDLWAVLSAAPLEVHGLRKALVEGKIDGSSYEGECACLVGTIANVKGCNYKNLGLLKPDHDRPIEMFFTAIAPGQTPDKNENAKKAVEWIDQWLENVALLTGAGTNK